MHIGAGTSTQPRRSVRLTGAASARKVQKPSPEGAIEQESGRHTNQKKQPLHQAETVVDEHGRG